MAAHQRSPIPHAVLLVVAALGSAPGWAATLSYDEARTALEHASDARKAGEAALGVSTHNARAADSLALPDVSLNAKQVFGIKTATLSTPLGPIHIDDNLGGPRASIDTTWSLYNGGRVRAPPPAPHARLTGTPSELGPIDPKPHAHPPRGDF